MPFDPTRVVTNGIFDNTKYEAYSPAFLPATLALAYGLAFASFSSIVVHTFRQYLSIFTTLLSESYSQYGTVVIFSDASGAI